MYRRYKAAIDNRPGQDMTPCHNAVLHEVQRKLQLSWNEVETKENRKYKLRPEERSGWQVVRLFVSSTFKDMFNERELLIKEVLPELKLWCEELKIYLIECDLRWGVPKDSTSEDTIKACMEEIDRCKQDNGMPFFINFTGHRTGWIPTKESVPEYLAKKYEWNFSMSVTEMEIIHAAYRSCNPNALFLLRDDGFIKDVPLDQKHVFVDPEPEAKVKLKLLKENIEKLFQSNQIYHYGCEYAGYDSEGKTTKLKINDGFKKEILKFFKERITVQYGLTRDDHDLEDDTFEKVEEDHRSFVEQKQRGFYGREKILNQITNYIENVSDSSSESSRPLLLLGQPGIGKSALMAKMVYNLINGQQSSLSTNEYKIYYHFVGAVPGSTEILPLLKHLLDALQVEGWEDISRSDEAADLVKENLRNTENPIVIFIDALNQLDSEREALDLHWIPEDLSPNVRCVLSMIPDSDQHKHFKERGSSALELVVDPLTVEEKMDIAKNFLKEFNKELDDDQFGLLLNKKGSDNPLWLTIACEELRIHGKFRTVTEKIKSLKDDLLELIDQILDRMESEILQMDDGKQLRDIFVGVLCSLEVSYKGLLEVELLTLLADSNMLDPGGDPTFRPCGQLSAAKWTAVYHRLKRFLRPVGNSSVGRLDFYHRSVSKVVRTKYLKTDDHPSKTENPIIIFWHLKLASYFEQSDRVERQVEEYPYHLIMINDSERMRCFLKNWKVFNILDEEISKTKLLTYWRQAGGYELMGQAFKEMLEDYEEDLEVDVPGLPDIDKATLVETYDTMILILGDKAFQFDAAGELLTKIMTLAEKLDMEQSLLVRLGITKAGLRHSKLNTFMDYQVHDLPHYDLALETLNETIKKIEEHNDKSDNRDLVTCLRFKSEILYWIFKIEETEGKENDELLKQSEVEIDRALELAGKEKFMPEKANCLGVKGQLYERTDPMKTFDFYKQAEVMLIEADGYWSSSVAYNHYNIGMLCRDFLEDYKLAFDYFQKSEEIFEHMYGVDHKDTQDAREYKEDVKEKWEEQEEKDKDTSINEP